MEALTNQCNDSAKQMNYESRTYCKAALCSPIASATNRAGLRVDAGSFPPVSEGNGQPKMKRRTFIATSTATAIFAALVCLVFESALAQSTTPTATDGPAQTVPASLASSIVLPTGFNDPIEPFNRA